MTEDLSKIPPIVEGEFEDHDWRAAASKKPPDRKKADHRVVAVGPRLHPYSPQVVAVDEIEYVDEATGAKSTKRRFFRNEEHRSAWLGANEGPKAKRVRAPESKAATQVHAGAAEAVSVAATMPKAEVPSSHPSPLQAEVTKRTTEEQVFEKNVKPVVGKGA